MRLILRLLVRRQNRSLSDSDWKSFLNLQSHTEDFKAQKSTNEEGLTTWQTLELMSQAVLKYSGTRESLGTIQDMLARVMINTHTLTTPTLDPLGLCLEPQTALLNHSCTPNAHIVFDGRCLSLRSLANIPSDSEVTLSYIDTTNSAAKRRAELESRYFFTCKCSVCSQGITNGQPDPPNTPQFEATLAGVLKLQADAASSSPDEASEKFRVALSMLEPYSPHRQPRASMLHQAFLNALATQSWSVALRYALMGYFHIEPVHYPVTWHPVRVVRTLVLLRLVIHIAGLVQGEDERVKVLSSFDVDWRVVAEKLWAEVHDGVLLSHGKESGLAGEVRQLGEGLRIVNKDLQKVMTERQWVKLRLIADSKDYM